VKRSEMLGKIAAVIINYNEPHRYTDRETAIEIAETILAVQEEAGMQPPNVTLEELFKDGLHVIGDTNYYAVWEDE
jgi:hypothetical protein